ncbi:MAG: phytoene desaturase [Planctomycetes bacterium]|nr:phytoene desaturase [Planctomycetota bacterium]
MSHESSATSCSDQRTCGCSCGGASRPRSVDRVAIIGAGPGGLASAVLLAASGLKVTVYEAAPAVGGRCGRIEADGYRFDKGPTFFMMPYVLEEIFKAAGRRLTDYVELTRLDPMYRLLIGRGGGQAPYRIDATQNIEEMARRLGEIDPADGAAFPSFIEHNRSKLRHSEAILRNPMRSPLDLFRADTWRDTLKVAPLLKPHLTVHQLLSRYFRHPAVRLAVSFQSKYLGMSPYECPSLFTILPFIEYEYGIWHPTGGCASLMHALAEVAREHGAEIVTNAPVEQILFEPGTTAATGVRLGGEYSGQCVRHEHLVVNADATWAMKNLMPAPVRASASRGYSDEAVDAKRYSCSTYMLYLGVRGETDLPHHTIYISEDYKGNLEDITTNGRLSEDPSVYVCNPVRTDPALAPPGHSALYVLAPTPNLKSGVDWPKERAAMRERVLDQLEARLGLKGIRGRIEREVELTPRGWEAQNINFGATFNLSHNLGQMLHMRPQNRLKGFDNVYLVGGGTHPGSGLPTIFLSAQISSKMVCDASGTSFAGAKSEVREVALSRRIVAPV